MNIKNKLKNNLLSAMKEKDAVRKNALRMALSAIKLAEVESGKELDDPTTFGILQKEIKTRDETIAEAKKANRLEMVTPLEAEIEILKDYLPKELSDEELIAMVKKIVADIKATSMKEMGLVMKSAIHESQGKASNDRIIKVVRDLLSGK